MGRNRQYSVWQLAAGLLSYCISEQRPTGATELGLLRKFKSFDHEVDWWAVQKWNDGVLDG